MKKAIVLVSLLFSLGAFASDDAAWEAGALWKPENPKFTEKGSREFQSNGPMLRSIRVSKRAVGAACTGAATSARIVPTATPMPANVSRI